MGAPRVVVWFSCGAASAVAGQLAIEKYGSERVHLVYCDVMSTEHHDNARFLKDVERWLGKTVEVIRSARYESIDDVFDKTKYMSGVAGARCTAEMKKKPRFAYQKADDVHVFGLLADEADRIANLEQANPELHLDWILRDSGVTKADCLSRIMQAGIALPAMYALGFRNNNCIGCVKAQSPAYWHKVRQHFPDVFKRRCEQSRSLGVRLIRVDGARVFLDELPPMQLDLEVVESVSCGPDCGYSPPKSVAEMRKRYAEEMEDGHR